MLEKYREHRSFWILNLCCLLLFLKKIAWLFLIERITLLPLTFLQLLPLNSYFGCHSFIPLLSSHRAVYCTHLLLPGALVSCPHLTAGHSPWLLLTKSGRWAVWHKSLWFWVEWGAVRVLWEEWSILFTWLMGNTPYTWYS